MSNFRGDSRAPRTGSHHAGSERDGFNCRRFLETAGVHLNNSELLATQVWAENLQAAIALWRHRENRRHQGSGR